MKYSEFLKAIQTGKIQPVLTFLGEEVFLKRCALDALLTRFLPNDSRSFNFRSLAAEDLRDAAFLDEASTMPMFGEWKVLYLKDASALEKSFGRIGDYLQNYLDHPSPATILVFDIRAFEGRSRLKGILMKQTAVVEFNPLSDKEIPSWVNSHLRSFQFQIESDAVRALSERLGTDLQRIAAALDKLMLLCQAEKKITSSAVESSVGFVPIATIWQWTEALLDQKPEQAIKYLDDLLEEGEEPIYCIALLAKQYEKMILAKEMVEQKVPQATISQKINKPVYYLQKYLMQLSRFRMQDLVKAIEVLAYADRALKTGLSTERIILHWMVAQLCNLKCPAPAVFDVVLQ